KVRLADAYCRLGKLTEAEKLFRDSLADREAVMKTAPRQPAYVALLKADIGQGRMYLGDFHLFFRRDRAAAAAEYAACLDSFAALAKQEPDNLDFRQRLAASYYRVGVVAGDPEKAKQAHAECLKLREELAAIDRKDMQSGVELALVLARCGKDAEAEKLA